MPIKEINQSLEHAAQTAEAGNAGQLLPTCADILARRATPQSAAVSKTSRNIRPRERLGSLATDTMKSGPFRLRRRQNLEAQQAQVK